MISPPATSPMTFAFCPSLSKAVASKYHDALSTYLAARNCVHIGNDSEDVSTPDLLVIAPPVGSKASRLPLRTDDLLAFQELLGGLVLYIDPTCTDMPGGDMPAGRDSLGYPPVFTLKSRISDRDGIARLSDWLHHAKGARGGVVKPKEALDLVIKGLGLNNEKRLLIEIKDLFGIEYAKDYPQPHWWDVLYALRHVAASYDIVEHDLNRYTRHPFSQGADALARLHKKRDLLNTANDLWKALTIAAVFRRATSIEGGRRRILLVDDNPEGIKAEITGMIQCLMPNHEVWCWNPNQKKNEKEAKKAFEYLCCYNSLIGTQNTGAGERTTTEPRILDKTESGMADRWHSGPDQSGFLDDILKTASFVLVDLLFRIGDTKERELGAALIRGLRRYVVDHPLKVKNEPLPPPRFIAFSRSDDLEKIQKALRAGASGYVLKNRSLGLPAELARLRVGTGSDGCLLHRNFHALDALPNETKGLLHEVRIPPIRFDRPHHTAETLANCKRDPQVMASLLRAIPKPDLHLHVGSCMTPEFLVIASILMLAARDEKLIGSLLNAIPPLFSFWMGKTKLTLDESLGGSLVEFDPQPTQTAKGNGSDPVDNLGTRIREILKNAIEQDAGKPPQSGKGLSLRSLLHAKLSIRDHWTARKACEELDTKDAVSLMLFAITTGKIGWHGKTWSCGNEIEKDDVLRLFILFWASHYEGSNVRIRVADQDFYGPLHKLKNVLLGKDAPELSAFLKQLGECFATLGRSVDLACIDLPERLALDISLGISHDQMLRACPTLRESPLEFLIASGTRGRTLAEYLAGCEYAGAEHLRRPGLMRLYARQTMEYLVRHGVLYAELRSAVSGYASKGKHGMTYQEACTKFQAAFGTEQEEMMDAYREAISKSSQDDTPHQYEHMQSWAWCSGTGSEDRWLRVFGNSRSSKALERRFPAKVNLIFTGKRHKATRELLMEAAAGVMLNSESSSEFIPASTFTSENMTRCRVVGFDLAGLEESFPPEMFRAQFEQLSRMHIPITAHAGENASARFVESAVLDLRARRLGHGLALADDRKLMARVREERICIELCPVSNYQTNEFTDSKTGRKYPLKDFYEFGNIVCLNTDNPIVSYTNIVKEFFQASYACGADELSLWDALRMIRMGFAHAFKGLAERRALIELVEQMVFDLLIDPSIVDLLRKQANQEALEGAGR